MCSWHRTAVFSSVLVLLNSLQFFCFGFCTVCCLMCMDSILTAFQCFITVLFVSVSRASSGCLLFKILWCTAHHIETDAQQPRFSDQECRSYCYNVKNHSQTVEVGFLKTKLRKWSFWFLNLKTSSVQFGL